MVDRDIIARGVTDQLVQRAMGAVPRERFVPADLAASAYEDRPLPIGDGQTISQPFIVAMMAAAAELTSESRVLEIGTGSGYGAAVLAEIAAEVWTVERHESLASRARELLRDLGYDNVHVVLGDGTRGLSESAPFDAIVVTAGSAALPEGLVDQLIEGGRIVIPLGPRARAQRLMRLQRIGDGYVKQDLGAVRFVPLITGPCVPLS